MSSAHREASHILPPGGLKPKQSSWQLFPKNQIHMLKCFPQMDARGTEMMAGLLA